MKTRSFKTILFLLCLTAASLAGRAQTDGGYGTDPFANCPPFNTPHCIYFNYPASSQNNCPLEVCIELTPTPYMQSRCPLTQGPAQVPNCITLSPGTSGQLCFNIPAGADPNTWFTFRIKVRALNNNTTMLWNFIYAQPIMATRQGGCGPNLVKLESPDGVHFTLDNGFYSGIPE